MRVASLARPLTVVLAAALAGGAGAVNVPATTYVDRAGGYAITVPSAWRLIPRSRGAVETLVTTLRRRRKAEDTALAAAYASIAASPTAVTGLRAYRFQAFAWPPDTASPLLTEVSVGVVGDSKAFGRANLTALGDQYASALASGAGSKVRKPERVRLPADAADLIEATVPVGHGLDNGIELYLIPHGLHVYELEFSIDARLLGKAKLFTAIARAFKVAS